MPPARGCFKNVEPKATMPPAQGKEKEEKPRCSGGNQDLPSHTRAFDKEEGIRRGRPRDSKKPHNEDARGSATGTGICSCRVSPVPPSPPEALEFSLRFYEKGQLSEAFAKVSPVLSPGFHQYHASFHQYHAKKKVFATIVILSGKTPIWCETSRQKWRCQSAEIW